MILTSWALTLTPAENKGGWKCTVGCERGRPVLGGLSFQCFLYFCIFLKGETRMQKLLAIKYRTYLTLRIVHHFWRPAWRLHVCGFNGGWWAILSSSTVSTNSVWIPGISLMSLLSALDVIWPQLFPLPQLFWLPHASFIASKVGQLQLCAVEGVGHHCKWRELQSSMSTQLLLETSMLCSVNTQGLPSLLVFFFACTANGLWASLPSTILPLRVH